MKRKMQAGFTMIELVIVIIILGILAATAMPKFFDMQVQAKQAKLSAAYGAIKAASAMMHSSQLTSGGTLSSGVTLEGGTVVTMCNGYPTPDATGIIAALDLNAAAPGVGTHEYNYVATGDDWDGNIIVDEGDVANNTCRITYLMVGSANCLESSLPPTIGKTFTTCTL